MLHHHPATSESPANANWRSGPRSPMPFSSARLLMVRTGRRVSHYHPEAASAGSNQSNVRPRPLRKRCSTHTASRDASNVFKFGGPRVYSYEHLLRSVAHQADLAPLLISIPFAVWHALAWAPKYCRLHSSLAIRWSSCRSTPWLRQTNLDLRDLEFHRTRSRQYSIRCYRIPHRRT
jgi:hypothetical protein